MARASDDFALIISNLFVVLICGSATIVKERIRAHIERGNISRLILLEYVTTLQMCMCELEFTVTEATLGIWIYAFQLFLFRLWCIYMWEEECANPINIVIDVLREERTFEDAFLLIPAQLFAGLLAFAHISILWRMELTGAHSRKVREPCITTLRDCLKAGVAVESFGAFICSLIGNILDNMDCRFANVVFAFSSTAMTIVAHNYTGGFFNPAKAASQNFGCKGVIPAEHMMVYWIGPILGSLGSFFLYEKILHPEFIEQH